MSNPLTATDFIAAGKRIASLGVTVQYMPDWKSNCRCHRTAHNGTSGTIRAWYRTNFFALHHTGGADNVDANASTDSYLNFLAHTGQGSSVPGPLCTHFLDEEDGKPILWILSIGRTNNFGNMASNALSACQSGTLPLSGNFKPGPDAVDGNARCIGMEVSEDGRGEWKPSKYWAAVIIVAEFIRQLGWNTPDVLGHKEGTTRKTDPALDMGLFRARVKDHLAKPRSLASYLGVATPSETTPESNGTSSQPTISLTRPTWSEVHALDLRVTKWLKDKGVNSEDMPETLRGKIKKCQNLQGFSGGDADGIPGASTLKVLGVKPKE